VGNVITRTYVLHGSGSPIAQVRGSFKSPALIATVECMAIPEGRETPQVGNIICTSRLAFIAQRAAAIRGIWTPCTNARTTGCGWLSSVLTINFHFSRSHEVQEPFPTVMQCLLNAQ
jgi:hypothetical protein